jgi:hypothetical protein
MTISKIIIAAMLSTVILSGCGSIATYGPEYSTLTDQEKYFVGPWDKHGEIDFEKPYQERKFSFDDWDQLLALCGFDTPAWQASNLRRNYGDEGLLSGIAHRPMGCYIDKVSDRESAKIVWLEGREDVFLHELAHHYGVIEDDHR